MDITSYLLGKKNGGGGSVNLQNKSITITQNGTQNVSADSGYDGLRNVSIVTNTPVPRNWTQIGYNEEPNFINVGFNYAKQVYDNYVATTSWQALFEDNLNLIFVPLINTEDVESFRDAFNRCNNLLYVPAIDTKNSTEFRYMFNECFNLKYIDFTNFNTINAVNMRNMFSKCYSLTELDLSNFETPRLEVTNQMFKDCINLKKIDMRNMYLENIENYTDMFGANSSSGVPDDCEIIVGSYRARSWILSKFDRLTNVKIADEL